MLRTVKSLADTPGFPEAFARAAFDIEARAYVIVDAYTHAPITPYAPIPGRMGIRADIERNVAGMTALPVEDVTPERRRAFADTLDRLAHAEALASDLALARWEEWRAKGNETGMRNALARANRAAAESDRLSDRAHHVRTFSA